LIRAPKSRDSYRDVPVPESARDYAITLRTTEAKFILEMKKKDAPCKPAPFRDHFKKGLEGIPGVRVLTPHSCRHAYVSQTQTLVTPTSM